MCKDMPGSFSYYRLMLRIFFGVLGIILTTESFHRKGSNTKVHFGCRLLVIKTFMLKIKKIFIYICDIFSLP